VFWSLPFDAVARARGDGGWILRTSLFFAPLSIAATWLAAGRWGAMGALIAALGSKISMRLYSLVYDRQGLGVSISKFLPWKEMVVQAILALFASAVSILLRPLFSDPRLWFAMTGPLFVLIYFGATYSINLRQLYAHVGPTRVLELTQTLGLGGLERTLYLIADRLNQSWSFNVRVAAYEQTDGEPSLAAQIQKSGIPLTQWHKGRGFSFRSVIRLVHIIFSERIRIVHAHDLGPLVYGSCAKLCSLGRVRLVLTLHTLLDIQHNRRYRFYYKVFLRFADKVIAVSPAVQAGLLDLGISPDRVEVIPNGVSFTKRALQHGESDDKLTRRRRVFPGLSPALYNTRWALSLARIHPGKGQDILLDLWRELPEETRQGMVLFFVGQETDPGFAQALREKVRNAPDSEHIVVAGSTEQPEEWLQCADIFLSGSIHEGMPLAPLEAAGAGLPVCLSDIEGHRFLQAWARYFDPAQPRIGAAKIGEILQELDSERENEFFEKRWNGASLLRERWGSNAMTASYAKLFQTGEI
jgi:glycosyltransferase involved in cell wall biosynthesis